MSASLKEYRESVGDDQPLVSRVTPQVKRRDRVSVFVDDQFAFGISEEVARRHGVVAGSILDPSLFLNLERDESMVTCKRVAISYMSYRMRSEAEVRRRLSKEQTTQDVINTVVEGLHELGLLDDRAFAGAYSRDAIVVRKWGPHRIARGLRQAGVGEVHLIEVLKEVRNTLEDEDLVLVMAKKRWSQLSDVTDLRKRKKRLYDYLTRRGFDFDDVKRVLNDLTP